MLDLSRMVSVFPFFWGVWSTGANSVLGLTTVFPSQGLPLFFTPVALTPLRYRAWTLDPASSLARTAVCVSVSVTCVTGWQVVGMGAWRWTA